MIRLRLRDSLRRDEGVAMIFVIAIGFVVALLAAAMFASVLQNQRTTRLHRNITSAQAAAEAALDDAVYQLGLGSQWKTLPGSAGWSQGTPHQVDLGTNDAKGVAWFTKPPTGTNVIVWAKGTYGANTRTIRAVVTTGSPPAFDFSMFGSKGIDIHQHGGWLSPQAWTTSVHSNGYIYIDYPSEFNVNRLEAVGNLTLEKGGGKIPSGSVTSGGYSWLDPLNGLCYPGGYASPGGTADRSAGACPYKYPGTATINGSVYAGSLTMGSHGAINQLANAITLDTGQILDGGTGNGMAKVGSSNITTCAAGCAQVQKGITITPGYAPDTIPFPSINFSDTSPTGLRGRSMSEANAGSPTATNYFTSPSSWLTWATGTKANYYNASADGTLTAWNTGSPYPDVILLKGDYNISGGSLSLDYGTVQKAVQAATGLTSGGAPIILIQGSLVVENGGISLGTGLVVVGGDNHVNGIVIPGTSSQPTRINTSALLDATASSPGILAAGGQINSADYDTDSPWSSTSTYEPMKAAPVYVRGLIYSASWNATTGTSTPQNQHWHNYDPKNLMKVYGAQVGADLHDCNNFSFTYDPIVKNAFGFGGGSVKVIDYQELGT